LCYRIVVVDTGKDFHAKQVIALLLIQIGGRGIIIFNGFVR
jgi:hypothetical protein